MPSWQLSPSSVQHAFPSWQSLPLTIYAEDNEACLWAVVHLYVLGCQIATSLIQSPIVRALKPYKLKYACVAGSPG